MNNPFEQKIQDQQNQNQLKPAPKKLVNPFEKGDGVPNPLF